jgi:hypothetical protein
MKDSLRLIGILFGIALILGFMFVALTDAWPYMHEVIWQQSWRPVCPLPNGGLEFCKP